MRSLRVLTVVAIASLIACDTESRDLVAPRPPGGLMASIGVDPVSGATIETNQDDYLPGELVRVTGSHWAPGETVHLDMTEDPDTHGDVTQDVPADSAGAFSVPFYDVQDHDLGVTFRLTATGGTSGSKAVAVFTDGRAISSTTFNGSTSVTVASGASITARVQGQLTGNGQNTLGSIGISTFVHGANSSTATVLTCFDVNPDLGPASGGNQIPFDQTFSFNAPTASATYDVIATSYGDNSCAVSNGAFSATYANAITVASAKANQTITFGPLAAKTYGNAPFSVSATSSAGLTVSFSSQTPTICGVAGSTVTILQAGSCTVRASQGGDASFNPAPDVDQSFSIAKAVVTATAGSGSGAYNGSSQAPVLCQVTGAFTGDLSCANSPAFVGPAAGTFAIAPLVSGTGLSNFDITPISGSYTIARAAVTATAGGGSGTYNGNAQFPSACSVTGAYVGDLTCANSTSPVGPDAGTFTITPIVSGTGLSNFDLTSVDGSYVIARASVTATAGGGSGTYNGNQQSPTGCVVSGPYTGDLTCGNNPIAVGPAVGATSISPKVSGTGLDNFDITSVDGSYTIAKAPVTATAGSGSATYNGLTHAPSACGVTGSYTGNLFCTNSPAAVGPDVGTVVISPAVSGEDLNNFDITAVAGSYEIQKAPVTATAGSGSSTYDGNAHEPSTCAVAGTFIGGLSCANDPASVGPDVGTFSISPLVSGPGQSNFDITLASGSYEIKKAPVTATAGSGSSTYDGDAHEPSTCAVTGAFIGNLSCANAPASVGPDVGTFAIHPVVSGPGQSNFDITLAGGSYEIKKAPVTATAGSGSTTYDGGMHAPSACTLAGTFTGSLSCSNSPGSVGPNAGTSPITPVVSGPGQTNFILTLVNGSYTIDRKAASVTPDAKAKFFGDPDPALTGTLSGFVPADNVTASYSRVPGENVGTYTISATLAPAGVLGNYDVTYKTAAFTIMAWTLNGFYQPVDMPNPSIVWNTVKSGSTVPLKFEVFVGGVERTDMGAVKSFASYTVACNTSSPTDDIEFTTTGGTVLRYDATAGQFIQNWQTPRLAGQCFKVIMTTQDGSWLTAYFKLK
ncbi:MAG TPA: PxKF domain-containing protein [Gemmatimonadales bacterium]|nr:PxKF domain-containing protein [Gemmatimonadales bacterium]